jgi:hypothetical protein
MPTNEQILANLRAMVASGAPQRPVRSHVSAPAAQIGPRSRFDQLQEKVLPMSDEPLAQIGVGNGILKQPYSAMPSGEDMLGMSPVMGTLGKARPGLSAFKPKQPMPSEARMGELMQKFGGGPRPQPAPLPMDEASRMARAAEQGYTTPAYHGTVADFKEFGEPIKLGGYGEGDFGIHVSQEPKAANMFGNRHQETIDRAAQELGRGPTIPTNAPIQPYERGGQVLPLMVNPGKSLEMPDVGIWRDPQSWIKRADLLDDQFKTNDPEMVSRLLEEARRLVPENKPYDLMADPSTSYNWQSKVRELLQDGGYGSIKYPNFTEGHGDPSLLLLDPRQARSKFAAFDPAKRNSRDLLASLAAALGIGGAAASHEPE